MGYRASEQEAKQAQLEAERDKYNEDTKKSIKGDNVLGKVNDIIENEKARSTTFYNPGSASYGRDNSDTVYKDAAMSGSRDNDAEQASNNAALANSISAMKTGAGGSKSIENADLSNRESALRGEQSRSLGLARSAAMGLAPSEAAFQTKMDMNNSMGAMAGAQGGARGLAAMNGAQSNAGAMNASAAQNYMLAGGLARSKEMADNIGLYSQGAGKQVGQDLTRLGISDQNQQFNQTLDDSWRLGNAQLAAQQGGLGAAMGQTDMGWYQSAMRPEEWQFKADQEMAAEEAGASIDKAAAAYAQDKEARGQTQALVGGITQAGLSAVGSLAGPMGTAAGGMMGSAINSATAKYY